MTKQAPSSKKFQTVATIPDPVVNSDGILTYTVLKAIVWNFADVLRDKGQGTVEDYARITIPTLAIKRIMDLSEEAFDKSMSKVRRLIDSNLQTLEQALENTNSTTYHFFDTASLKAKDATRLHLMLLTWGDLMAYPENPNGDEITLKLKHGGVYTTKAKNFMALMFEVIDSLNPDLQYVFNQFDYKVLLTQKNILSYAEFYKVCHANVVENGKSTTHGYSQYSLSNFKFDNEHVTSDIFGDVYMDLIGRFAHDSGKKGGEFFTPTPLVNNAIRFLNLMDLVIRLKADDNSIIRLGDPTSGSNTFHTGFHDLFKAACAKEGFALKNNNVEYYGQELKSFQASMGYMNMVFHGLGPQYNKNKTFMEMNQDVISKFNTGIGTLAGTMDVVLGNPPYGLKDYGIEYAQATAQTDRRWRFGVPKSSEGEFAFIMTALELLNAQGLSVLVLPLGTLFRDSGKNFRKGIVSEDLLEGLITLPANMFLTTSIPVVLWVFNKNKKKEDKQKVFMVNASHDFKKVGKFNEWQPEKAIEAYHARKEIAEYSGYVDMVKMVKEQYNLNVSRYFAKKADKEVIDIFAVETEIAAIETQLLSSKATMDVFFAQIKNLNNGGVV